MPADAAVRPDTKTLLKAARWSLQYLIDPKRGALRKLPTEGELLAQFPDSNLTTGDIENWLYNEFGSTSLEAIAANQQKLTETIQKIERFESQATINEAAVPKITPSGPEALRAGGHALTPKPKVSALGVLAELESIEPILAKHRLEATPKLEESLQQKVEAILPKIGARGLDKNQIPQIAKEIAQETARETLENVAKIQDVSQINQVLADSLTQSIIAHPQIAEVKTSEGKLYEQVFNQTQDIVQANHADLEKAAVLGAISQIAKLKKPDQQTLEIISDQVGQTIQTQAPLTSPETQGYLTGALGTYLTTYVDNFEKQVAPSISVGQIPSFDQLQKIKDVAHNQTVAQVAVSIAKSKEGKIIDSKIGFKPLTEHIASVMGLKPLSAVKAESLGLGNAQPKALTFARSTGFSGLGVGLILNSPPRQVEAYHSLLAYNKPRLEKTINDLRQKVEWFKKQPRLSYRQKKELLSYGGRLKSLSQAQQFPIRQPKRFKTYLAYFQSLPVGRRLDWASQSAWTTTEAFLGQYQGITIPKSLATNPVILSGRTFGSLSFGLGNFNVAPAISVLQGKSALGPMVGMGGAQISFANRVTKAAGLVFGGLFLYFLGLGQAALTGFLIGAGIGMAAGGGLGFALAVATGPFFPLTVVPFTLGGMFVGGSVGGVAGGLIGLGMASGSTTAITTGVGAGVGGTTGAVVGGILGSAFGPFGTFFGAIAGAYIGSLLGGALGYAIGHYVIGTIGLPATGAIGGALIGSFVLPGIGTLIGAGIGWLLAGGWTQIKDFFASAGTTTVAGAGGVLGTIGGFFTGVAATIWGGITSAGGAILGGLSAAGNFIVGGLASLTVPASAAAIPVVGGISAVAVGGTIVGIVAATSFFSTETDLPTVIKPPGENQYFTITKTANPTKIENNNSLPQDITFTIILTAKDIKLTNILITDQLTVQAKSGEFPVTTDKNGNPISPPCGGVSELLPKASWTCTFTITATKTPRNFSDSVVSNTISVKTTPEGQSEVTDSAFATVIIGNPPTICIIFDLQGPWTDAERNSINEVCKVLDRSAKVVQLLQNASTISLIRVSDGSLGGGVCGTVNGSNSISIACDMSSVSFAKYVISHELGHVLGNFNGSVYRAFLDSGAYNREGLMPTYPFSDGGASESFAEMIGDYVASKIYNFPERSWSGYPGGPWVSPGPGWTTFKNDRPLHYNFAKSDIFGRVEY